MPASLSIVIEVVSLPTVVVLVEILLKVATLHLQPHLSFPTHKTDVIVLGAL